MSVEVNFWAVVLAAVSSMAIGAFWYSNAAFAKPWIKFAKLDPKNVAAGNPPALVVAFVSSLVMAYVLAHVTYLSHAFFGNSFMQDALTTAFWMWFGFQAFRTLMQDMFEGRRKKHTLITTGNALVTIMVMGLIIGAMGL